MIGANMSLRRSVFDVVGGFRDGIGRVGKRPLGCEETELCIRARQQLPAATILFEPSASVAHRVPRERASWRYYCARCYAEGLSKAAVASAVGTSDSLSSERAHVLRTLPRGVIRGLADALRLGDAGGLARAAAIVGGLALTVAGYVRGRLFVTQQPAGTRHPHPLHAGEAASDLRRMKPPFLRRVRTLALLTLLAFALAAPAQASATAGFRDFSWSAPSMNGPTAHKPQSKLWFNDGAWWGYMFDRVSESWHIYRLNGTTQQWTDTGTAVDSRNSTWADVLWDGSKLYIASAGASATNSGDSARLYRYSYNPTTKQYTADTGFPSTIVTGGMEAIVLDKDSTGKLWVTYTRDSRVYVNDSSVGGGSWGTPFIVPVSGSTVSADDISTVIRYNGRIGVMWSNQVDGAVYFASHADGAARTSWGSVTVPLQGTQVRRRPPEHPVDRGRQRRTAVRGREDVAQRRPQPQPERPPVHHAAAEPRRQPGTSTRSAASSDKQTRPILMLDDRNRKVYVFFTTSTNGATIDSGTAETAIYYKSSGLDSPSFAVGRGTPAIELDTDRHINDVTSTKQNVNGTNGLVLLASDNVTKFYMHSFISLGSPAVPTVKLDAASDTGRSATDGITSDSTPSFSGTAPAGSTVSVRDGATTLGSATANSSGAWSFQSPSLAQGEHTDQRGRRKHDVDRPRCDDRHNGTAGAGDHHARRRRHRRRPDRRRGGHDRRRAGRRGARRDHAQSRRPPPPAPARGARTSPSRREATRSRPPRRTSRATCRQRLPPSG